MLPRIPLAFLVLAISSLVGCHERAAEEGSASPIATHQSEEAAWKVAAAKKKIIATTDEQRRKRRGKLDVTFFVASDTHLGFDVPPASDRDIVKDPIGIEVTNLRMIASMNERPGAAWPQILGGLVGVPRGVLITGDLTEHGGQAEWEMFEAMYATGGAGGPLSFPVFEADGNHDRALNWVVREQIARRHGGRFYSMDWDDLHLICLAEAPDEAGFDFLRADLQKIERDVPVVLYLHLPLLGRYSDTWWSRKGGPEKLEAAIAGHNVVAIFHGHYHASGAYRWKGYDVYNVGSPKNSARSYAVVHVEQELLTVASFNYELNAWWWWHQKPINGATQPSPRSWMRSSQPGEAQPYLEQ